MLKNKTSLLRIALLVLCAVASTKAQVAPDEIVSVNTRVVFVDALVKDKRTGKPLRDLTQADFQVLDDGKPRTLSYFSREGDSRRRPLSLLLTIDLEVIFGRVFLKSPDAIARMTSALTKLAPEDEVAVMIVKHDLVESQAEPGYYVVHKCQMVEGFTPDRGRTVTALLSVPRLAEQQRQQLQENVRTMPKRQSAPTPGMEDRPPGGLEDSMLCSTNEMARVAIGERRNSRVAIAAVTDDFNFLKIADRERAAKRMLETNVTYNGLVFTRGFFQKIAIGASNWAINSIGLSHHATNYLAKQSGGEVARIRQPKDLAEGLERIIGNLASRYSIGFTLDEGEQSDGRMHNLEVRVRGRDKRGKELKAVVETRRGYYLPPESTSQ